MTTLSCTAVDDVVNFAIEKEEKAMEFYDQCATRAQNPGIRKFFKEMAEEEQRHRDMLKGLNPVDLGGVKLEQVEDLRISDYLIDIPFKEDLTYQEALILAMKKEEKAYAFYSAWKGRCGHERTAKLFQVLENEEQKHKRKLETLYDEEILTWD